MRTAPTGTAHRSAWQRAESKRRCRQGDNSWGGAGVPRGGISCPRRVPATGGASCRCFCSLAVPHGCSARAVYSTRALRQDSCGASNRRRRSDRRLPLEQALRLLACPRYANSVVDTSRFPAHAPGGGSPRRHASRRRARHHTLWPLCHFGGDPCPALLPPLRRAGVSSESKQGPEQ